MIEAEKAKLISILNQLFTDEELHRNAFNRVLMSDPNQLLEDLRLTVKYTMFDLEATRRENQELVEKLKSRS